MPKFSIVVDHTIARDDAVERLRAHFEESKKEVANQVSNVSENWDEAGNLDFSFSAMGFSISGRMETEDSQVKVNGELPFAALPFRGALENQIASRIRDAIV
jgi:hypothetical protein